MCYSTKIPSIWGKDKTWKESGLTLQNWLNVLGSMHCCPNALCASQVTQDTLYSAEQFYYHDPPLPPLYLSLLTEGINLERITAEARTA